MIYFAIAVLLGISIYLVFRYVGLLELHTYTVIVTNYWVCSLVGILHIFFEGDTHETVWKLSLPWAAGIGLMFVSTFYMIAVLTRERGVGISSILSRVSLVIPVLFFLIFFGEKISPWQILGIVLSIVAIVLINFKKGVPLRKGSLLLPLVVFLGYGVIDILLKLAQDHISKSAETYHVLTTSIFLMAGIYGVLFKLIKGIELSKRAMRVGVFLGLINYYSIFFLFEALEHSGISSTIIFPLNGVLILLGANVSSILLFKEQLGFRKLIALGLAVAAIILLNVKSTFG